MTSEKNVENKTSTPVQVEVVKWYSYIFALFYILYGGVSIVLGFLDRKYDQLQMPFIFLLLGIVLVIIAAGFSKKEQWGYKGVLGINIMIAAGCLFSLGQIESYVLLILSLATIGALMIPNSKSCFQ